MSTAKRPLSPRAAEDLGVTAQHERMESGELRFRLKAADGSGYVRTVAAPSGGWQNGHVHRGLLETYIVQTGWIALVELCEGRLVWHLLRPGSVHTTRPGVPHNVYLPGGAVIHTVKHGDTSDVNDWCHSPELDAVCKRLQEEEILRLAAV